MRELTSANCGMAGEYFFAKLFFWVVSVCTEASAEASTVTRKKNVKKKPNGQTSTSSTIVNCAKMDYLAERSRAQSLHK